MFPTSIQMAPSSLKLDAGLNAAFLKLKPICDSIASNPTKKELKELRILFATCPANILQRLHEYILFPLYIHLDYDNRW